jgi:uncharacterized protein YlzI (FlbEa/FlbD family)
MIIVTRLHGAGVAVNGDLIERTEATGQHLYLVPTPDPDS